jgi:hypothetical protein
MLMLDVSNTNVTGDMNMAKSFAEVKSDPNFKKEFLARWPLVTPEQFDAAAEQDALGELIRQAYGIRGGTAKSDFQQFVVDYPDHLRPVQKQTAVQDTTRRGKNRPRVSF